MVSIVAADFATMREDRLIDDLLHPLGPAVPFDPLFAKGLNRHGVDAVCRVRSRTRDPERSFGGARRTPLYWHGFTFRSSTLASAERRS